MILLDIFGQNPILAPGTGTFTEHLFEIVAMLVVAFLLGLWLGRIAVNKWRKKGKDAETELSQLKAEALGLEDKKLEIMTLQEKVKILEDKNSRLRMESSKPVVNQNNAVLEAKLQTQDQLINQLKKDLDNRRKREADFQASIDTAKVIKQEEKAASKPPAVKAVKAKAESIVAAVSAPKTKTKSKSKVKGKGKTKDGDDLKKIEGVGPKIEQLLNDDGIQSYNDIIALGAEKITAILLKAGPQYKVHDPSTWGDQAQLALDEKWEELHEMQAQLKGGKKV
ncbi:MAG: putative flap endonuclease-1-like 5' DNA nuclease [bacterium]|jgi:predicted flap endonuclease-1-like 5' DNA nuclease